MPNLDGLDIGGATCAATARCGQYPLKPLAFSVVGDARSFVAPDVFASYATHVLESFGAHSSKQLFLYLKHDDPSKLQPALAALRPARAQVVSLSNHSGVKLAADTCLPPWAAWRSGDYQARALRWWLSLEAAWSISSFFSKPADLVATGIPQPNSAKIVAEVCANPASPPRRAHRVRHARLDIRSAGWITFCVLCVAQARSTQLHTSIIRRLVEAGATRQLQKIWKDAPRPAKRAQRQAVDQGRQGNVRRLLCEAIGAAQLG